MTLYIGLFASNEQFLPATVPCFLDIVFGSQQSDAEVLAPGKLRE